MTTTATTMDTFRYYNPLSPPSSTTTTSAADSPNVLDALCATHDHRLDALPDLLDVFAGKGVVNKELTGQLHNQGQEAPPVSSPFAYALDASDPTDRAFAFAITGRVRNILQGINEGNSPVRSRRSSATSTHSSQDSFTGFTPLLTSNALNFDPGANRDTLSPTADEGVPPAKTV
jgi:hypothetical protein